MKRMHSRDDDDIKANEEVTEIDQTTQAQLWNVIRAPGMSKFVTPLLHKALKINSQIVVDILLMTGVNVNEKDEFKFSSLYYAVQSNNRSLINKIIAKGAAVDEPQGTCSESVLSYAIEQRLHDSVDVLLENGCNVNLKDRYGCGGHGHTPFSYAIKAGDVSLVRRMIQAGANLRDEFGCKKKSPLHLALGHVDIIELLLENGADVNQHHGHTSPLITAVSEFGDAALAKTLLDRGASFDAAPGTYTALHAAARYNEEALELLLARGMAADVEDDKGRTPLFEAAHYECRERATTSLLDAGADVNHADRQGLTPLHVAGSPQIVRLLVERGADVGAKDVWGNTPLLKQTMRGRASLIEPLISAGSDIDAENHAGVSFVRYCDQLPANSYAYQAASKFITKFVKIAD